MGITKKILTPVTIKGMELKNRVFIAPMTRLRTEEDRSMKPIVEEYYAQRSTAGLIICEAISAIKYGDGYGNMPEFVTDDQIASWQKVVERVHAEGGRIVAQLWHAGRVRTTADFRPEDGLFPAVPNPLLPPVFSTEELEAIPREMAVAAKKAIEIGFDLVEIHAGGGLLLSHFSRADINQRTDEYGGSPENRSRLLLNVANALIEAVGADRVAVKIGINSLFSGQYDAEARKTFTYQLPALSALNLAYLHINQGVAGQAKPGIGEHLPLEWARENYTGILISSEDFTPEQAVEAVEKGTLDAVAFGRIYIANPDLPQRIELDGPYNEPKPATFYSDGVEGYLDYPALEE